MPDDRDRALAQLAIEAGFLSRDEAAHYWQRLQAPGSPTLAQLLAREGRLDQRQLEQLRARWQQAQRGQGQPQAQASAPPQPPPQQQAPPAPGGGEEDWNGALEKDAVLARVLLSRGVTTQERLRECRQLQLQHRMRLGVVLVRKGYVDRPVVEEAIEEVRRHVGSGVHAHPPHAQPAAPSHAPQAPARPQPPQVPQAHAGWSQPPSHPQGVVNADDEPTLLGQMGPGGLQLSDPFASVRGPRPQQPPPGQAFTPGILDEAQPTLLDDGGDLFGRDELPISDNPFDAGPKRAGGGWPTRPPQPAQGRGPGQAQQPPAGPPPGAHAPGGQAPPFDPMRVSVELLNPFAGLSAPPPSASARLRAQKLQDVVQSPQGSVDELDAFADVPLGAPPSPGADPMSFFDEPTPGYAPHETADAPDDEPFDGTLAPGYIPGAANARGSGLTPTGVPVGGQIDSDSARIERPKKKGSPAAASGGGGAGKLVLIAVVLFGLFAIALVGAYLIFG